jgi:YVTN family beta-propeller protein
VIRAVLALLALAFLALTAPALAAAPLALETKIPLDHVFGRIDHMAIDVARQRLFIAERGNDSVGVVDLKTGHVIATLRHMEEPEGVAYVAATDTLYVTSGLDGKVRLFHGAKFTPAGKIAVGPDPDTIRVDAKTGQVLVGYGAGGIAAIDAATGKETGSVRLADKPGGFAIAGDRIFVNVPYLRQVAVIDRPGLKLSATWPMHAGRDNFPMAIEGNGERIITVFRRPAELVALSPRDGSAIASIDTCLDANDVFVDARRNRLYVSCAEGVVDVLERRGTGYARLARVPTSIGAQTSLFVPALDRLYVAAPEITAATKPPAVKGAAPGAPKGAAAPAPAKSAAPAAPLIPTPATLWVFRPVP